MNRSVVVSLAALAACSVAMTSSAQLDGPEWVEEGDAGSNPGNAQNTTGEGPLLALRGSLGSGLGGGDFEDMYWIFIEEPRDFRATTSVEFNGFAEFDSQLWLFQPI